MSKTPAHSLSNQTSLLNTSCLSKKEKINFNQLKLGEADILYG